MSTFDHGPLAANTSGQPVLFEEIKISTRSIPRRYLLAFYDQTSDAQNHRAIELSGTPRDAYAIEDPSDAYEDAAQVFESA